MFYTILSFVFKKVVRDKLKNLDLDFGSMYVILILIVKFIALATLYLYMRIVH